MNHKSEEVAPGISKKITAYNDDIMMVFLHLDSLMNISNCLKIY